MDLKKIREMNDEELEKYLKFISSRKVNKCSICKNDCNKVIKIEDKKLCQTKQLCGICDECYDELLKYLNVCDVLWN